MKPLKYYPALTLISHTLYLVYVLATVFASVSLLQLDPQLATCRFVDDLRPAIDSPICVDIPESIEGLTPLHVAAGMANLRAVYLLLENEASTWVRDLQGRTPLHLAAIWGSRHDRVAGPSSSRLQDDSDVGSQPSHRSCDSNGSGSGSGGGGGSSPVGNGRHLASTGTGTATEQMCSLLRAQMKLETGVDPVGANAPLDLTGATPLGRAAAELRQRGSDRGTDGDNGAPTPGLVSALFSGGDPSVLPRTPHALRTGGYSCLYKRINLSLFCHYYCQPCPKSKPLGAMRTTYIHNEDELDIISLFCCCSTQAKVLGKPQALAIGRTLFMLTVRLRAGPALRRSFPWYVAPSAGGQRGACLGS